MKPLSKAKKSRILDLLFSGKTYREIGTIEHVSTSTVSKVFNEFVGVAEDSSIIKAAEEYNVRDRVDRLLELSAESKKAKTSIPRLLSAARLMSFMNSCGLKPSQLRSYLEMCDKHRENMADFASKSAEFFELEERTGKPYEKIVKEYPTLVSKRTEIREEIGELRTEKKRAKKGLDRELASNNLTRKEIFFASILKRSLIEYDFTVEDTYKIPNFLREIEACGGDSKVFLERAEEANTLDLEIRSLKREKRETEPIVEGLRDDVTRLKKEVVDLKDTKQKLTIGVEEKRGSLEALKKEAAERNLELQLLHCLTDILMSKPVDVDLLYTYSYSLKQIRNGRAPEQIPYKPAYEESVRKLLLNAFLKYFGKDLAPKEKVTELEQKLQSQEIQIGTLSDGIEQLNGANGKLSDRNTALEKQVEELTKQLEECQKRMLQDPTIQPKDRTLPFRPT